MSSIIKPVLGSQLNLGHPLATGLVGLWLFNEGSGDQVFDLSGNNNTGILAGSAPWEAGKFGPNPHYDGSTGRHRVEYSPELYCGEYMTLSFWAKSDISNYASNAYVVSMYDYAGDNRMWSIRITAATDKWAVVVSLDGSSGNTDVDDTSLSVDTSLHHFVFVVDNAAKTWDFYLDGIFVETITKSLSYTNQGSFITFGGLDDNNWFDGIIDVPSIYNRSLSASEVALLHREPFCMFERDLIELWSAATLGAAPTGMAGAMTTNTGYWGW